MAMYLKGMHSLQVRMDAGKNPETGKTQVISKTFDNIDMSITATNDAQTTPLYEFAKMVNGICGHTLLEVVLHQHGSLEE